MKDLGRGGLEGCDLVTSVLKQGHHRGTSSPTFLLPPSQNKGDVSEKSLKQRMASTCLLSPPPFLLPLVSLATRFGKILGPDQWTLRAPPATPGWTLACSEQQR